MYANGLSLAVLGILLPTLIHVSLFTLVFMILGAYRSGSRMQTFLIVVYLTAIGLILAMPASGIDANSGLRESRTRIFWKRRTRIGKAFRDSGPSSRHAAYQPARLHLHLPLP